MGDLVDHLYAGGHWRIGFFGLCPEVTWSCSCYGAYLEAMTRHGLEIDSRLAVRIDLSAALSGTEFRDEVAFNQVKTLLSEGVDAWVCPSAMTNQSLCRYLLANGVRLPEDLSLVSYHGNSCPSSADLPVITTSEVVAGVWPLTSRTQISRILELTLKAT
ncbi:MAG: substrate-binding domain-containing protein [Opitutus sp.]|nr:substrate-binding domain-containing protein [Opitutus sp.]